MYIVKPGVGSHRFGVIFFGCCAQFLYGQCGTGQIFLGIFHVLKDSCFTILSCRAAPKNLFENRTAPRNHFQTLVSRTETFKKGIVRNQMPSKRMYFKSLECMGMSLKIYLKLFAFIQHFRLNVHDLVPLLIVTVPERYWNTLSIVQKLKLNSKTALVLFHVRYQMQKQNQKLGHRVFQIQELEKLF